MPNHGDRRNWRIEEVSNDNCSHSFSVNDRFCSTCGWVEAKGVIGGICCPTCGKSWS